MIKHLKGTYFKLYPGQLALIVDVKKGFTWIVLTYVLENGNEYQIKYKKEEDLLVDLFGESKYWNIF